MEGKSILRDKSYAFAIRVVKLSLHLQKNKKEFVLNKQILRSGTAIGALIREAEFGQSRADFIYKMTISLKEANETEYWLLLLMDTDFIEEKLAKSLIADCVELIKMLIATIKTAKDRLLKTEKVK
jgi:four helix bundle protein